jgi:hypothetical protein
MDVDDIERQIGATQGDAVYRPDAIRSDSLTVVDEGTTIALTHPKNNDRLDRIGPVRRQTSSPLIPTTRA